MRNSFSLSIKFDRKAKYYMITQSDIAGLYLQDNTVDALVSKIRELAPRLLADNHPSDSRITIDQQGHKMAELVIQTPQNAKPRHLTLSW
jgi:hypothetical protein